MEAVREADDASIYWRFTALDRLMPIPTIIASVAMCWLSPNWVWTSLGSIAFLFANMGLSVVTNHRYRHGASEREMQYWIGPIRGALAGTGVPLLAWVGQGTSGSWLLGVVGCCFLPFAFTTRLPGVLAASLVGILTSLAHLLAGAPLSDFTISLAATLSVSLIAGETVHNLQSLITRVRSAEAAKSEFLANVSHEIRTPMNGILGTLELISNSKDSEDQRELARVGYRSARGLLSIINDVLDFSKIEAGKMQIHPAPFAVDELVSDMRAQFAPSARENGITFTVEVDPQFPHALVGDVTRVAQVIRNFLSNALKFAQQRSVTLRLRVERDADGADCQVFEVLDTGIGMTPDQLTRVFQKFEQAEAHTTKKFGGTGLGLAISQTLAEKMGGIIGAESEMGEGSRFWIRLTLPVHAGSIEAVSAHFPLSTRQLSDAALGLRILVVDDNKTNRLVAARLLKALGCETIMASSGQEAIDACKTQNFDAVLMDCQMPEMDGFEATQRIHALPKLAELPIIALTASALVENQEKCAAAGMSGFLSKPVGKAELRQALRGAHAHASGASNVSSRTLT